MTNSERGGLARKIHIRAMIALIDHWTRDNMVVLARLITDLTSAEVATFNPTKQGDRITIYGVMAVTDSHDAEALLRAWQIAARKFLETR